jgi:ABC-2 type transport system permease protein
VYTRYELLRTVRNRRFFLFSLIFPLVLFFLVAGPNRHQKLAHIPFAVYYMTGMLAWGSMQAVIAGGGRIALERTAGWTRQMRITPLSIRAYFGTKVLSGYLIAGISIVLLCLAGVSLGVSLTAGGWAEMIGLVLIGLIPFALLGIVIGHLAGPDSVGPLMGGLTSLLALLGGAFGPLATSGALHQVSMLFPSYWLVEAGKAGFTHQGWTAEGWLVIILWSVVLARLARIVYRRDTARVPA